MVTAISRKHMEVHMSVRVFSAMVLLVLAMGLVGCGSSQPATTPVAPTPSVDEQEPVPGGAAGMRLAPGLYDIENGKVQAIGTLEYSDIEGGFWAVIGGTEGEGNVGEVVAVIANGDEFKAELAPLKNKTVNVIGERLDGASIRMAGPEITMESVEEMSDTPGIAE